MINATQRGFTLVEMIVAVAVFSIVMMVGAGALLSIVDANRRGQAQQTVINNLNFAIENISRNIRVGSKYHCGTSGSIDTPRNCISGESFLAFEPNGGDTGTDDDQVIYRLNGSQIEKSTDGGLSYLGITAPEIDIDTFTFYVDGAPSGDGKQPRVLLILSGHAGAGKTQVLFNLQTTISQRLLDI